MNKQTIIPTLIFSVLILFGAIQYADAKPEIDVQPYIDAKPGADSYKYMLPDEDVLYNIILLSSEDYVNLNYNESTEQVTITWDFPDNSDRGACYQMGFLKFSSDDIVYIEGAKFVKSTKDYRMDITSIQTNEIECKGEMSFYTYDIMPSGATYFAFESTFYESITSKHEIISPIGMVFVELDTLSLYLESNLDPVNPIIIPKKSNGGGCNDCTPPTFGKDVNGNLLVRDGFSLNGNYTDVLNYHVPWDLIILPTEQTHTFTLKAYENNGINNFRYFQIGFGVPNIGDPLNDAEVLLEIHMDDDGIEKVVTLDKYNLMDFANIKSKVVPCGGIDAECIEISGDLTFREELKYNVVIINAADKKGNAINHYINDGVNAKGESMNIPPTHTLFNKELSQNKDNHWIDLTRVNRVNDIWQDADGTLYSKVNGHYSLVTPKSFERYSDDISTVMTRNNSNFGDLIQYEKDRAILVFDSTKLISTLGESFAYDLPNTEQRQAELDIRISNEIKRVSSLVEDYTN